MVRRFRYTSISTFRVLFKSFYISICARCSFIPMWALNTSSSPYSCYSPRPVAFSHTVRVPTVTYVKYRVTRYWRFVCLYVSCVGSASLVARDGYQDGLPEDTPLTKFCVRTGFLPSHSTTIFLISIEKKTD